MEFSKQEYWSELPFPTAGDLPDPGIKPVSLASPGWNKLVNEYILLKGDMEETIKEDRIWKNRTAQEWWSVQRERRGIRC